MNNCIYCGSETNLVAQLTLTLDSGEKVTVSVCETHAEDATIRTAKQKYMERRSEIDDLMAKAKALGLTITTTPSGLLQAQIPNQENVHVVRQVRQQDDTHDMIDAELIEHKELRPIVSRGGVVGAFSVEAHESLDMSDIKEQVGNEALRGKVKMEIIERQSGGAVAIPAKKINGLGTTRIQVVQTTDQELQRRFKTIADQSKSPYGWDSMRHLGKEGVEIINCPICRGDGVTKSAGKEVVCPKCKGKGMLN